MYQCVNSRLHSEHNNFGIAQYWYSIVMHGTLHFYKLLPDLLSHINIILTWSCFQALESYKFLFIGLPINLFTSLPINLLFLKNFCPSFRLKDLFQIGMV